MKHPPHGRKLARIKGRQRTFHRRKKNHRLCGRTASRGKNGAAAPSRHFFNQLLSLGVCFALLLFVWIILYGVFQR